MHVVLQIAEGWLDLNAAAVGLAERRPVTTADQERCNTWATQYRRLLGRDSAEARLVALGREMYAWLDGETRWLDRLLADRVPPLVLEFQAPAVPDALAQALLQAPWELLANAPGYLAGDVELRYCPVRRLGRPQPPPSLTDHCLGLMFMAAAPRGVAVLNFEAEENAILDATGTLGFDLVVEESGNPDRLAERLAEVDTMQVLHLSCHGRSQPAPALVFETDEGDPLPTPAAGLIETLQNHLPRLLFVSACESSAVPEALADPLALTLVRAGVPAVLGWDGAVYDHEATAFASGLYESLSRRGRLEEAVGAARRALLNAPGPQRSRDWHRARLWLGRSGGGALVAGRRRRLAVDHGYKEFLDKRRQQSPVASREAFVGRRRELQTSLKVLREGSNAGLLIHGLGRVGKSSLAARLAHRRSDLALAVVFGRYDALSVAETIKDACPEAAPSIDAAREVLHNTPGALEGVLRQVLEGPCAQVGVGKPLLLVIDDLERILDEPLLGSSQWRVQAAYHPTLRAVLRAFALAHTDSRLLLTSRYLFTLPDGDRDLADRLYLLQLPPMDGASARKQVLHAETKGLAPMPEPAAQQRRKLLTRCVEVAQGNPGLQDLLIDLVLAAPEAATAALDEMTAYLTQGNLPAQEDIQEFLKDLALDRLLTLAEPGGGRELLRAMTLFELPVPVEVVDRLAAVAGGDVRRLMALGLVDRFEDLVTPLQPAVAINALVKPRAGHLMEDECQEHTGRVLEMLLTLWGGADGQRPGPANVELTRLALLSASAPVLVVCAADALSALDQQFAYQQAATWAQQAIALLDAAGVESPFGLLRRAGEACLRVGDVEHTRTFYQRALEQVATHQAHGKSIDLFEQSALTLAQARLRVQDGEPEAALLLFEQARRLALQRSAERDATVVMGDVARLRAQQGEVDEALRLHQEQLAVYERLGDVRERAVTLGDIARLRARQGEVDEALRLHQERLAVNTHLGDLDGQASAMWDIANIELSRDNVGQAAPLIVEAYQICDRINRLEGICIIGMTLGQLLIAADRRDEGLAVLRRSEEGFRRMQRYSEADEVAALISRLGQG